MFLEGFDKSKHNDVVPWPEVGFGFVRLSHGLGLDDAAPGHLAALLAAGAEPGGTHYLRGDSPGYDQAETFWTAVCDLGGGSSFALAVDLEHLPAPHPPWDRKVYRYRYLDFLKRLRELSGRPCATYSYRAFLEWLLLTPAEVGDSLLWLSDIQGAVEVPKPWLDWIIHQYSYTGPNGEKLDRDRFRGTREDFRRAFGIAPSSVDVRLGEMAEKVRRASGRTSAETFVNTDPEAPRIEG